MVDQSIVLSKGPDTSFHACVNNQDLEKIAIRLSELSEK